MRNSSLLVLFLSVLITLFGCATKYQPMGFAGGYSGVQLAENSFEVTFRGNGYTSHETVRKSALYRCAELTIEHGYDYYVIVEGVKDSKKMIVQSGDVYQQVEKPRETLRIKMHHGEVPEDNPNAFDAEYILQSIGPQLRIKE